jgi:hypothetical protein
VACIRGETYNGKGKGKCHPRTDPKAHRESEGIALLFPISALEGVGGQRHAPVALPPEKSRYPLYRRLGGPHGCSGRVRYISLPMGFDLWTVQPVESRYTDLAILADWVIMDKFL